MQRHIMATDMNIYRKTCVSILNFYEALDIENFNCQCCVSIVYRRKIIRYESDEKFNVFR